MASSNKTENFNLNIWSGADMPKRLDFNADNQKLDAALANHFNNKDIHLSNADKMQCKVYSYTGNGAANQTIDLDFIPAGVIVQCISRSSFYEDTANNKYRIYSSAALQGIGGFGISLQNATVRVELQVAASYPSSKTLAYLNENGIQYMLVAFRSAL